MVYFRANAAFIDKVGPTSVLLPKKRRHAGINQKALYLCSVVWIPQAGIEVIGPTAETNERLSVKGGFFCFV